MAEFEGFTNEITSFIKLKAVCWKTLEFFKLRFKSHLRSHSDASFGGPRAPADVPLTSAAMPIRLSSNPLRCFSTSK
jgi:hypothetical protein